MNAINELKIPHRPSGHSNAGARWAASLAAALLFSLLRSFVQALQVNHLALATFATFAIFADTAVAETQDRSGLVEQPIKAAYFSTFGSYVEWPPSAFPRTDGTFNIAVMGADALVNELVKILASAKGQAILTVSEAEDGLALGVMISARLLAAAYKVALGPS
jgi:hypothetical protein